MYLISIYFDEKTEHMMQSYINQVAKVTGNTFMIDGNIPPHITLLAFEAMDEEKTIEILESYVNKYIQRQRKGENERKLFFASIGAFKGQTLYIEPVLNQYLQTMSSELYSLYEMQPDVKFSPYYKPFGWIPHMSVGKHLDEEQMQEAFKVLNKHFAAFDGHITKIGIAKTNPHRDMKIYAVKNIQ